MAERITQSQLDKILPFVEKPARYTGGEYNSIIKEKAEVRFALCFPDVYEIGMSHLGSRIIYSALNSRDDIACERAYTPWTDMEAKMRESKTLMYSLETKRPLKDFDIVGFSLSYELCYTNILTMLDLAQIPFFSKERGEDMPLLVCGGASVCNIEPIADFFDCVLYGDGEEMVHEFIDVYKEAKQNGLSKHETLLALKNIKGVYIPSFYEAKYENGKFLELKKLEKTAPDKIERRIVANLDSTPFDDYPIVPNILAVHDRVPVELFRGCTRGCRFCQAGFIYRPIRERKVDTLINQAEKMLCSTGYDEVSLFSLSSGDYSGIHELVPTLMEKLHDKNVSLSLPSLRIDSYLKDSLEQMAAGKKTGLTFAPEAGTQRMRDVINKGVTEDDLIKSTKEAFISGWSSIKLYFMIGLPTETDEDILGIADLVRKVIDAF
ncbi:MAG: TIGR03960 family B12-binding radical SAM protein, partial [Clostridiales bacterium]|nr:TIGR03960 family B12-binding radical SAM protein [Clostridiales bacterium]